MSGDDTNTGEAPTRREYVKYGGVLLASGLLAGCAGSDGSDSSPTATETRSDSPTWTEETSKPTPAEDGNQSTETDTPAPSQTPSHTAEISPVGTVTLEDPPTNVFTHFP